MVCLFFLAWGVGEAGGQDSAAVITARNEVGDLFNLRKHLSGESSFPYKYRSYVREGETSEVSLAYDKCCGGDGCRECMAGEAVQNLQAIKFEMKRRIEVLQDLGCPCSISQIYPSSGAYTLKAPVEVTVSGLLLDQAFARGPIECWWRSQRPGEVETYTKVVAEPLRSDTVACLTAPQTQFSYMEVSLHGDGWSVTKPSVEGINVFESFNAGDFGIVSASPIASPSVGGVKIMIVGRDLDPTRDLQCRVAGVRFPAQAINTTHATCTTPAMPAGKTSLTLSQNGYTWIEDEVDFWVYNQPNITVVYPPGGLGNELVKMNLAGLGLSYEPKAEEIFCRWLLQERNVTVPAIRIRNSSTVSVCACLKHSRSICATLRVFRLQTRLVFPAGLSLTPDHLARSAKPRTTRLGTSTSQGSSRSK